MSEARAAVRLDQLTGVRGLAAWLVVFYHIRLSLTGLLPAQVIAVLGKGYLAVDFFFMLSGFVLWINHGEALARGSRAEALRFWWKRLARIWPLHALVLAGFVALAGVLAATGRNTAPYPLAELPLHVLLLQNWGFTKGLAWNHPAWSISTELAAYLLFPLLALSGRWRMARGALVAALGLVLAADWAWFAVHGQSGLGSDITALGLMRCLLEFAAGVLAARLWQLGGAGQGVAALLAGSGLILLAAGFTLGWPETAFVPAGFTCVLLALAFDRGAVSRVLGRGVVLWLGEASYSTYLAHFGLFVVFKLLFVDASLQLDWLRLAGFCLLLLAASGLLYRTVEKPAQRWLLAHRPGGGHPQGAAAPV